jgi:hypothetical protein
MHARNRMYVPTRPEVLARSTLVPKTAKTISSALSPFLFQSRTFFVPDVSVLTTMNSFGYERWEQRARW